MAKEETKNKAPGATSEMTYDQFLIQHERLSDNRGAAHEHYRESQANYKEAQENHGEVKQRYDAASDEERPQLQGEMDDSTKWLQTSANNLQESGLQRDAANDQLAQFEWQHREFDDFRRSEAETEPSMAEKFGDKLPSVDQQFDYLTQGVAVAGVATNLNVATPDIAQNAQDYAHQPHAVEYEMPAPPSYGELKPAPEPKDPLGPVNDAPIADPRDTSEKVGQAFKEHDSLENAYANARDGGGPPPPPGGGAGGAPLEIQGDAKFGDPTLAYDVSLPPTPDNQPAGAASQGKEPTAPWAAAPPRETTGLAENERLSGIYENYQKGYADDGKALTASTDNAEFMSTRMYASKDAISHPITDGGAQGRWSTDETNLTDFTPEQLKDRFALPEEPTHLADRRHPAGQELTHSVAGENEMGKGGGFQIEAHGERGRGIKTGEVNTPGHDWNASEQEWELRTSGAFNRASNPKRFEGEVEKAEARAQGIQDKNGDAPLPATPDQSSVADSKFAAPSQSPSEMPPTPDQRSVADSKFAGPSQSPPTPDQRSVADSKFAGPSQSPLPPTPDQQPAAAAAQPAPPSLSPDL